MALVGIAELEGRPADRKLRRAWMICVGNIVREARGRRVVAGTGLRLCLVTRGYPDVYG